jgi:hypothetical protein
MLDRMKSQKITLGNADCLTPELLGRLAELHSLRWTKAFGHERNFPSRTLKLFQLLDTYDPNDPKLVTVLVRRLNNCDNKGKVRLFKDLEEPNLSLETVLSLLGQRPSGPMKSVPTTKGSVATATAPVRKLPSKAVQPSANLFAALDSESDSD